MEENDDPIAGFLNTTPPDDPKPAAPEQPDDPIGSFLTPTGPGPEQLRNELLDKVRAQARIDKPTTSGATIPLAPLGRDIAIGAMYSNAKKRFDAEVPTDQDYGVIAHYELEMERRGEFTREHPYVAAVAQFPGMAASFIAGGKVAEPIVGAAGLGVSAYAATHFGALAEAFPGAAAKVVATEAGKALGRTAVMTAATPSIWLPKVIEDNTKAGRDPFDLRGVPGPFGESFVTLAVLGAVASATGATLPFQDTIAGRAVAQGLAFPIGQQLTDLAGWAVGLKTEYGTVQDFVEGKNGEGAQKIFIEFLTGAAFSLMHGQGENGRKRLKRFKDLFDEAAREDLPPEDRTRDRTRPEDPPPPPGDGRRRQTPPEDPPPPGPEDPPPGPGRGRRRRTPDEAAEKATEWNAYETLGVPRDATRQDITSAFNRHAMRNHPDRGGNPVEFRRYSDAMDALKKKWAREDAAGAPRETPAQESQRRYEEQQERQRRQRPPQDPPPPPPGPANTADQTTPPPGPPGGPGTPPGPGGPVNRPGTPAAAGAKPTGLVDVRQRIAEAGDNMEVAGARLRQEAADHVAAGGTISLWMDGKEFPVTVKDGKLIDSKGNSWGLMPLAQGLPGTKTGIEFKPAAGGTPVRQPMPGEPQGPSQKASGENERAANMAVSHAIDTKEIAWDDLDFDIAHLEAKLASGKTLTVHDFFWSKSWAEAGVGESGVIAKALKDDPAGFIAALRARAESQKPAGKPGDTVWRVPDFKNPAGSFDAAIRELVIGPRARVWASREKTANDSFHGAGTVQFEIAGVTGEGRDVLMEWGKPLVEHPGLKAVRFNGDPAGKQFTKLKEIIDEANAVRAAKGMEPILAEATGKAAPPEPPPPPEPTLGEQVKAAETRFNDDQAKLLDAEARERRETANAAMGLRNTLPAAKAARIKLAKSVRKQRRALDDLRTRHAIERDQAPPAGQPERRGKPRDSIEVLEAKLKLAETALEAAERAMDAKKPGAATALDRARVNFVEAGHRLGVAKEWAEHRAKLAEKGNQLKDRVTEVDAERAAAKAERKRLGLPEPVEVDSRLKPDKPTKPGKPVTKESVASLSTDALESRIKEFPKLYRDYSDEQKTEYDIIAFELDNRQQEALMGGPPDDEPAPPKPSPKPYKWPLPPPTKNLAETEAALKKALNTRGQSTLGRVSDFLHESGAVGKELSEKVGDVPVVLVDGMDKGKGTVASFTTQFGFPVILLERKAIRGRSIREVASIVAHEAAHAARDALGRPKQNNIPYDERPEEHSARRAQKASMDASSPPEPEKPPKFVDNPLVAKAREIISKHFGEPESSPAGPRYKTAGGRELLARMVNTPAGPAVKMDFRDLADTMGPGAIMKAARAGSFEFARKLTAAVRDLGEAGFKIAFDAEDRRAGVYEKFLAKNGFEQEFKPDPNAEGEDPQVWKPVAKPSPHQVRMDRMRAGQKAVKAASAPPTLRPEGPAPPKPKGPKKRSHANDATGLARDALRKEAEKRAARRLRKAVAAIAREMGWLDEAAENRARVAKLQEAERNPADKLREAMNKNWGERVMGLRIARFNKRIDAALKDPSPEKVLYVADAVQRLTIMAINRKIDPGLALHEKLPRLDEFLEMIEKDPSLLPPNQEVSNAIAAAAEVADRFALQPASVRGRIAASLRRANESTRALTQGSEAEGDEWATAAPGGDEVTDDQLTAAERRRNQERIDVAGRVELGLGQDPEPARARVRAKIAEEQKALAPRPKKLSVPDATRRGRPIAKEFADLAVAEGMDVESLHQQAAIFLKIDQDAYADIGKAIRDARKTLLARIAKQEGLTHRKAIEFLHGVLATGDYTNLPDFDTLAIELAGRYKGLVPGNMGFDSEVSADTEATLTNPSEVLFGYLKGEKPTGEDLVKPSERGAYERAFKVVAAAHYEKELARAAEDAKRFIIPERSIAEIIQRGLQAGEAASRQQEPPAAEGRGEDPVDVGDFNPAEFDAAPEQPKPPPGDDGVELYAGIPIKPIYQAIRKFFTNRRVGPTPPVQTSTVQRLPPLQEYTSLKAIASEPRGIGRAGGLGRFMDPRARAVEGWKKAIIANDTSVKAIGNGHANRVKAELHGEFGKDAFEWDGDKVKMTNGVSIALGDLVETELRMPGRLPLTPTVQEFVRQWGAMLREMESNARASGRDWTDEDGNPLNPYWFPHTSTESPSGRLGVGHPAQGRFFRYESDGIKAGVKYVKNAIDRVANAIRQQYRMDAGARLAADPDLGGMTPLEWFNDAKVRHAGVISQMSPMDRADWMQKTWNLAHRMPWERDQPGYIKRGFIGKIYPRDVADALISHFGEKPYDWLNKLEKAGDALNTMKLTADFALGQIQLALIAFRHPTVWAKAQLAGIERLLLGRDKFAILMRDPHKREVVSLFTQSHGIIGQPPDWVEGTERGSIMSQVPLAGRMYTRFGDSVASTMDVAKLEAFDLYLATGRPKAEWARYAEHLENMLGQGRTRSIGVTQGRRVAEKFAWIGPAYYRSGLNMLADLAYSDRPTQIDTLRAFGSWLAGSMALTIATMIANGMKREEIARRLDIREPRTFMMVDVKLPDGSVQRVGEGGLYLAVMRMTAEFAEWSKKGAPVDYKTNNPLLRFAANRQGFVLRLIQEVATQRDWRNRPQGMGEAIGRAMLPSSVGPLTEKSTPWQKITGMASDFLGLKNFPIDGSKRPRAPAKK